MTSKATWTQYIHLHTSINRCSLYLLVTFSGPDFKDTLRTHNAQCVQYPAFPWASIHISLFVCISLRVALTEHVLIFTCLSIPPGSRNSCLLELRPACTQKANQREPSHNVSRPTRECAAVIESRQAPARRNSHVNVSGELSASFSTPLMQFNSVPDPSKEKLPNTRYYISTFRGRYQGKFDKLLFFTAFSLAFLFGLLVRVGTPAVWNSDTETEAKKYWLVE